MYDLLVWEKIIFKWSCDVDEIKVTDYIIKVRITSGNIKWRSFALRFCASNHKSTWQPLLPSVKGLSFTFIFYPYTIVMVIFTFPFYTFFPFGKHYVLEKDPDIYIHWDVGYHKVLLLTLPLRWKVGRQNYKPLSFSMSN